MKSSLRIGLSFGLTSGVITTLGLMVGLYAGTQSPTAVLGGIFTIAVADALSDVMGIHLAEESTKTGPVRHIWEATAATFVAKFVTALSFAAPVLLLDLQTAILGVDGVFLDPKRDVAIRFDMTRPGRYEFRCSIHPNMTGELLVLSAEAV